MTTKSYAQLAPIVSSVQPLTCHQSRKGTPSLAINSHEQGKNGGWLLGGRKRVRKGFKEAILGEQAAVWLLKEGKGKVGNLVGPFRE